MFAKQLENMHADNTPSNDGEHDLHNVQETEKGTALHVVPSSRTVAGLILNSKR